MSDYMKMKILRITDQLQRSWMHFIRLSNSRKKAITVVNNGSKRGEVYLVGEIISLLIFTSIKWRLYCLNNFY